MANATELEKLKAQSDAIRAELGIPAAGARPKVSGDTALADLRQRSDAIRAEVAAQQKKPMLNIPGSRQSLSTIGTQAAKKAASAAAQNTAELVSAVEKALSATTEKRGDRSQLDIWKNQRDHIYNLLTNTNDKQKIAQYSEQLKELDARISGVANLESQKTALQEQATMSKDMTVYGSFSDEDRRDFEAITGYREGVRPIAMGWISGLLPLIQREAADRLYTKYGREQIDSIVESYTRHRNAQSNAERTEAMKKSAQNAGLLDAALSIPLSLTGNILSVIENADDLVKNAVGIKNPGGYTTLDPNTEGDIIARQSQILVQGAAKNFAEMAGAIADPHGDHPQLEQTVEKVAETVYSAGYSAAKNLLQVYLVGGAGSLALSGVEGYATGMREATEKGATPGQAFLMGLVSGGAEVLTEKLSLDSLFGKLGTQLAAGSAAGVKSVVKDALKQGGVEVMEEELNFLTNLVAEAYILREKSGYNQTVATLEAQGMTHEQAIRQAQKELLKQAGETAIQSMLSGGMMSAASSVATSVQPNNAIAQQAQQHIDAATPQTPTAASQTAVNKTGENGAPQAQTAPTQAVTARDPIQKTLDVVNSTVAQLNGDPANPLETAVTAFRENGTVSNKLADAISRSPDAVRTLVNEVGLRELPRTASEKRAAIKQAVTAYAEKTNSPVDNQPQTNYDEITTTDQGGNTYASTEQSRLSDASETGLPGGTGPQWVRGGDTQQVPVFGQAPGWVEPGSSVGSGSMDAESGDGSIEVQLRVSPVLRVSDSLTTAQTGRGTQVYSVKDTTSSPNVYEQALVAGRNSNAQNGWCVTPKSAQELAEGNVRTFMNENGTVGVGIAPDGDIVAVFKNQNGGPKRALDTMMPIAIEQGGDRLDCYGEGLVYTYENYGFVPVARVEFNAEYANEGWTPDKGTPYIYFMVHNGDDAPLVVSRMGRYSHATQEQLDSLPTYGKDDYDSAMAYRDGLIEQRNAADETTSVPAPPHESVGAADANFTGKQAYYDLLSDDNVKPGRPGDVRDVEIPETDGYGRRVSDFASNAVGAEVTTDEMADAIKELTGEGALGFDVKSDKSLLTEAENNIKEKGLESSKGDIREAVDKGKVNDVDIVKATLLYNIYNSRGDVDSASEMMVNLAAMANDAGRKLRLFGLLRKMTPEGQAAVVQKTVQRTVDRINKSRSGKSKAEVTIPQELMDAYTDAARRDSYEHSEDSERAKVEAEQAIYKAAAAQIKASPMEKLNAWRYMAMLGNAKTQIRNFAGNALFRPLVSIKRTIGAAIESATLEQKDRTKAVLGFGKDAQDLIQWADEDAGSKTAQELLSYCGHTGDAAQTAIDENRQIFDTKWLESVREFVKKVPEGADMLFKKREYSLSLASFLKARGYTAADIQSGKVSQSVLNEGRAYAAQEALKATFNDQNALSDLITNMRYKGDNKALQLLNILGEGVMPFRRTPANIVARGLEYSPIGLLRGIGNAAVNVRTGKVSAATAIDQIAGGLTGTGMMVLGAALASGIFGIRLRGKVEEEEKLSGHQSFALEIGGKSYDISWLAPANLPLLVGANLYELGAKDGNDGNWLVNASSATVTALEPMLELSCLSSLNDLIESVRYGGDSAGLYTIAASAATSYLTQFIPTLLGQVEQAFEDTKNSTYSNADTPLERSLEKTVGQITQRIPGIDLFQTEKVDKWGRTQEKGAGQKIFDAFINPSKVTTIEETAADAELERLRDAVPDENVYPGSFRKEISYTDSAGKTQKKELTAEEYATLAKTQGQQSRKLVEKISGMEDYKDLTDAQKAKVIQRIYDYTAAVSKSAVVDSHEEPSWVTNRAKGMSIEEAILRQEIVGTTQLYTDLSIPKAAKLATMLKGILPEPGHTNARTIQKIEAVTGADSFLSEKEQKDVLEDILPDETFDKYVEILAAGYSSDDFATAYRIDLDIEGEGAKEKTIRAFMKEFGTNRFAATKLYDLYHPKKEA